MRQTAAKRWTHTRAKKQQKNKRKKKKKKRRKKKGPQQPLKEKREVRGTDRDSDRDTCAQITANSVKQTRMQRDTWAYASTK
jgi:hypothetical protein